MFDFVSVYNVFIEVLIWFIGLLMPQSELEGICSFSLK